MANYYEILKLEPSSNIREIQIAIDEKYNNWRHLITHHDSKVAEEANRAIRTLEQIRSVLLDPVKKADYDASLSVGGLADPEAILRVAGPTRMPTPPATLKHKGEISAPSEDKPSLWTCIKCKTDNPPQTIYCYKCGAQLVQRCPECNGMSSLVSTGICGNCGYKYEIAQKHMILQSKLESLNTELQSSRHELKVLQDKPTTSGWAWLFGFGLLVVGIILSTSTPKPYWNIAEWKTWTKILLSFGCFVLIVTFLITKSRSERKNADVYNLDQAIKGNEQEVTKIKMDIKDCENNKTGT